MVKQKEVYEDAPSAKAVSKKIKKIETKETSQPKKKSSSQKNSKKARNAEKIEAELDIPQENNFNDEENGIHNEEEFNQSENVEEAEIQPELSDEEEENYEEVKENEIEKAEMIHEKNQLVKSLSPGFMIDAIYTGGKIQLANNEKMLFSLCNNEIVCFSLDENKITRKIAQENEEISSFAINPKENMIAYTTKNFLCRYVSLEDNSTPIRTWKILGHTALDMAIDPSGRLLALGGANGHIQVYDLKKGIKTHHFQNNKGPLVKVDFHPHPEKLMMFSISEDYTLKFYDLVLNTCTKIFTNFESIPTSFAILDDGINLTTCCLDEKINIYNIPQSKFMTTFKADEEIAAIESIRTLDIKTKENKTFLIYGGRAGLLKTLDVSNEGAEPVEHSDLKFESVMKILKFKHSNKLCVVTSEQNLIFISYSINSKGKLVLTTDSKIPGYNDEIIDAKFSKKSASEYFIYSTNSSQIRVFFPETKNTEFLWGHEDIVLSVDTFGDYIVSSGKDNMIKLWMHNNSNFILIATLKGHNKSVGTVNLSPQTGNYVVSGSSDQTIKLWSIKEIKNFDGEAKEISSAKNTTLAHQKDINSVKFAPNEKLIATASQDKTINIYQTEGLKLKMTIRGHKRGVWDIAFSPIEKILASVSGDGTLKLWNLNDGACMSTFEGHTGSVLRVGWISLGLEIITAGADGLLKLWNVKKMTCVNTFEKHEGKIWTLDTRFNHGTGKSEVLTGGNDSLLVLWQDHTLEEEKSKKEERDALFLNQQQLNNLIREKKFENAGNLAFDLGMVKRFIQIIEKVFYMNEFKTSLILLEEDPENFASQEKSQIFKNIINHCIEKDFRKLLILTRDLNTSSRHSRIANEVLDIILSRQDFSKLDELKKAYNSQPNTTEFIDFLDTLLSYSERHFTRIKKYVKKSFYVDFVLNQSFVLSHDEK